MIHWRPKRVWINELVKSYRDFVVERIAIGHVGLEGEMEMVADLHSVSSLCTLFSNLFEAFWWQTSHLCLGNKE